MDVTRCCASDVESTSIVMSALRMILRSAASAVVSASTASVSETFFATSAKPAFVFASSFDIGSCATEVDCAGADGASLPALEHDSVKLNRMSNRIVGDFMIGLHAISELQRWNVEYLQHLHA